MDPFYKRLLKTQVTPFRRENEDKGKRYTTLATLQFNGEVAVRPAPQLDSKNKAAPPTPQGILFSLSSTENDAICPSDQAVRLREPRHAVVRRSWKSRSSFSVHHAHLGRKIGIVTPKWKQPKAGGEVAFAGTSARAGTQRLGKKNAGW